MKKLLLLLLLAIPITAKAICPPDCSVSVGGNLRGLNNGDSSILIQDTEAQDLLNVDITKNGYGIAKRSGYAQFKTIGTSTWGVRGGYYFTDQAGNNKVIHANNTSVFYSLNGAAYTAFYTTATAGSYWDFVDSQGILYGTNNNHDPPFTYDGTSLTFSTSVIHGSQVEAYPDRLVVAGSTANPNNIYFSKSADFSNFTVGALTDDAAYFEYYGLPGQLVQAIKYSLGELLIWTKTSMGRYVGSNQYDGKIDDISSTIGTDQPSTVITDLGTTYFQGTDRHFYAYDGQGLAKISQPISSSVDGFVRGESKNAILTSQADFGTGVFGTGVSSITSPGDIYFDKYIFDNFASTTVSASIWTPIIGNNNMVATLTTNGAQFVEGSGTPPSSGGYYLLNTLGSTGTWSCYLNYSSLGKTNFYFGLMTSTPTDILSSTGGYRFSVSNYFNASIDKNGSHLITDTAMLPAGGVATFSIKRASNGTLTSYLNNAFVCSAVDTTFSSAPYIYIGMSDEDTSSSVRDGKISNVLFYPASSTYTSAPLPIGTAITSWGPAYISNVLNSGDISYALYTDTDTAITINDSKSWISSQTVTNNTIPTFATAPYVTWVASFSRDSSTQTPSINDLTVNWFEGTNPHNWGTVDKDHRILWSVAEGTASVPNTTYIYDPRFQSWLKYSIPFVAATKVGNSVYFGGVSTGVVYQWPSGNTDNGSAFLSFWKSKDFIAPDPYIEKDFTSISLVAKAQAGSNLYVFYTINTSSTIGKNFSLTDASGGSLKRINFNLPSGKFGTFFNILFGNVTGNSPFEFYSFKYDYKPRPWRVMQ